MTNVATDEQLAQMTKDLTQARIANWLATDLFTWNWWFIFALLVIPWIVFYFLADRQKLPNLWLYGTFLFIVIFSLDLMGYENGLWAYPYKILPFGPFIAYIDASPLPVIYMLEYQYFPKWRDFIVLMIITAMVFSFCFEPALAKMGLYIPVSWEYYYGLPIYFVIPILLRFAVEKIFASAKNHGGKHRGKI